MRNIQIIDGALNCEYAIYTATDEEFKLIFPKLGQNIEFIEDLTKRMGDKSLGIFMQKIWERRVCKRDAQGIHGTLFYQLYWKKKYYPTKREEEMIVPLANEAITPNDPRPL